MDYGEEFQTLVDTAYKCEFNANKESFSSFEPNILKIIYRDTRYNIDFLYTAYILKEKKVITKYAIWLYELMLAVLKNKTEKETLNYVLKHFDYIIQAIQQTISKEKQEELIVLMKQGKEAIQDYVNQDQHSLEKESRYEKEIQDYLNCLFQKNRKEALYLIQHYVNQGIPINDLYVDILAESMRRIGSLWHHGKISVDMEHYCTSMTQVAMSQLYPEIFSAKRKQKTILCACPGMELHEMGARMVVDVFENDGWDSIYLGAAVPEEYLLKSIEENQPDLIALSITMPQHLIDCQEIVFKIKKQYPNLKVAVGGHAFDSTDHLWKKWPIDIYAKDARDFLLQANQLLGDRNEKKYNFM